MTIRKCITNLSTYRIYMIKFLCFCNSDNGLQHIHTYNIHIFITNVPVGRNDFKKKKGSVGRRTSDEHKYDVHGVSRVWL